MGGFSFPKLIAHRGASAHYPENTCLAFQSAKNLGASWIEFDVMLSQDFIPMIFHDDKLDRVTNGKGRFADFTCAQLQAFDAGQGERIPTLEAVLSLAKTCQLGVNIELKPSNNTSQLLNKSLPIIQRYQQDMDMIISSFSSSALTQTRKRDKTLPLGLLLNTWQKNWLELAESLQVTSVHCAHKILNAKRIKEIKAAGYVLLCYTVNERDAARELLALGVDGIFSDYADLLS